MKNLLLWGWAEADSAEAMKKLRMDKDVHVVDWIADFEKTDIPHVSYIDFFYNHPDFSGLHLERDVPMLSEKEIVKFLNMYSREKRSRGVNFQEQCNVAKMYYRFFCWYLKAKEVDHILFSLVPIIGFDYLCYVAAKNLELKVTFCYQSLFPNKFFYGDSLEDFGTFENIPLSNCAGIPKIEWGHKKELFYMKGKFPETSRSKLIVNFLKETWRYGLRTGKKPMRYSGVIENFIQSIDFNYYYNISAKRTDSISVDVDYVYFPLHLQPELTTTGLGGDFSDQLDALERLSDLLPTGWKIYVKENPKQNYEQRGREFFRRLLAIEKVVYISKDVDTYWLMENSKFVATVTGTAGWEAITGGKPCLFFGLAWFSCVPGAIRYSENINVNDILNLKFDRPEQEREFERLMCKTRVGIVDNQYVAIHQEYDSVENSKNIYEFVRSVI